MKQGKIYPAIFRQDGKYITVFFPDLPGCQTQGVDFEEAFRCAREVLGLHLDDFKNPPEASDIATVAAENKDGYVMLIEEDTTDNIVYYKKEEIPKLIDEKLTERGYTKYKLAKVLDVNESYINLIAKGKRRPSPEMAKRIALVLDFDWQAFFA
ncbi:MAG: helix-turn-helix domain-containing protein [Clostridiales bacterium]|jgi:predicted RNase H-like HicB family nuclease/DNA-binding XRE family transcriptional regulator|nr:helix-turn-helix domain-containing protein [Clostridiales bacterium]